ncbi:CDP-alcohol phosphatidyltransferase family protein [Caldithrix abyssi]|nr:CDP-alcohol phosphatidyltransferase family protein [Caldithrix abyssi]
MLSDLKPIATAGMVSFFVLVLIHWQKWTPKDKFGFGNQVTLFRLMCVLVLSFYWETNSNYFIVFVGLLIFILDILDGWLARRFKLSSEFGDHFDKESDAFFMLTLCLLAIFNNRLGEWILIVGILRYVFVLLIPILNTRERKEHKSIRGRIIAGIATFALLGSFLPLQGFYQPFAIIATILIISSFALDLKWLIFRN